MTERLKTVLEKISTVPNPINSSQTEDGGQETQEGDDHAAGKYRDLDIFRSDVDIGRAIQQAHNNDFISYKVGEMGFYYNKDTDEWEYEGLYYHGLIDEKEKR